MISTSGFPKKGKHSSSLASIRGGRVGTSLSRDESVTSQQRSSSIKDGDDLVKDDSERVSSVSDVQSYISDGSKGQDDHSSLL